MPFLLLLLLCFCHFLFKKKSLLSFLPSRICAEKQIAAEIKYYDDFHIWEQQRERALNKRLFHHYFLPPSFLSLLSYSNVLKHLSFQSCLQQTITHHHPRIFHIYLLFIHQQKSLCIFIVMFFWFALKNEWIHMLVKMWDSRDEISSPAERRSKLNLRMRNLIALRKIFFTSPGDGSSNSKSEKKMIKCFFYFAARERENCRETLSSPFVVDLFRHLRKNWGER